MGDKADNIPGCPGVGGVTASKLIKEFGSVENIIANTDKLKGALKKKVEDNIDGIIFSKKLTRIATDAPIDICEEDLARKEIDADAIRNIFEELEFRTLIARVLGEKAPQKSAPK